MDTMFILGQYIFGISTAAPQEFSRDTAYNWPAQDVFSAAQALQFTGFGEESITLNGVIYTEFIGNTRQLDDMRSAAKLGEPYMLIDGRGNVLGEWVITQVGERQDAFAQAGTPLKQHFSMTLKRYGGFEVVFSDGGTGASALDRLRAEASMQTGLGGLLNLLDGAMQAGGISTGAFRTAMDAVGQVVGDVGAVMTGLQTGLQAAQDLKNAAGSIKSVVTAIKSASDIGSVLGAINSGIATINSASNAATRSGTTLLGLANSMPSSVQGVVNAAGYAGNQLATAAAKAGASIQTTVRGLL